MIDPTDIRIDDIVRLRKPHPCGGTDWRVVRLGADIGLICLTCERKVLIPRGEFARRVKTQIKRGSQVPPLPDHSEKTL
jgi:hypothetical protein